MERALRLEPLHYGALCGQGFMLAKLERHAEAAAAFARAIDINPSLGRGALGAQLRQCRERAAADSDGRPHKP